MSLIGLERGCYIVVPVQSLVQLQICHIFTIIYFHGLDKFCLLESRAVRQVPLVLNPDCLNYGCYVGYQIIIYILHLLQLVLPFGVQSHNTNWLIHWLIRTLGIEYVFALYSSLINCLNCNCNCICCLNLLIVVLCIVRMQNAVCIYHIIETSLYQFIDRFG